jgi:flagellar protein FlgJ
MRKVTTPFGDPNRQKLAEWAAISLDAAEKTARQIGCSPEAIVAQAALESSWGRASIGHNLFGIKADPGWTGKTQLVTTREFVDGAYVTIQAPFRDYDTFEESIEDHFRFLKQNGRYANVFNADSDEAYFKALQADGYATDPQYAKSLIAVRDSVKGLEAHMTSSP